MQWFQLAGCVIGYKYSQAKGARTALCRDPRRVHTRRMPLAEDAGELSDLSNTEPSHSNASALYSHTLTSGPESGLCNMLMALVGYVLLMRPHGFTALILPDFTSHDHDGVNEPFARLFDPRPMIE